MMPCRMRVEVKYNHLLARMWVGLDLHLYKIMFFIRVRVARYICLYVCVFRRGPGLGPGSGDIYVCGFRRG